MTDLAAQLREIACSGCGGHDYDPLCPECAAKIKIATEAAKAALKAATEIAITPVTTGVERSQQTNYKLWHEISKEIRALSASLESH